MFFMSVVDFGCEFYARIKNFCEIKSFNLLISVGVHISCAFVCGFFFSNCEQPHQPIIDLVTMRVV